MKVYNSNKSAILVFLPFVLGMLILIPYAIIFEFPRENLGLLVLPIPLWFGCLAIFRDAFCPFVINEKGITSKLPFRNIFIAWDDMKHIRVGERRYQGRDFRFMICFSKVPLKTVFISNAIPVIQRKKRFFIVYKDGMLEEVLKYVDESRIKDVSRIKNNPTAEGLQDPALSLAAPKLGDFKRGKGFWDL